MLGLPKSSNPTRLNLTNFAPYNCDSGILLKAKQAGYPLLVCDALKAMRSQGIWLCDKVIQFALEQAGEL